MLLAVWVASPLALQCLYGQADVVTAGHCSLTPATCSCSVQQHRGCYVGHLVTLLSLYLSGHWRVCRGWWRVLEL